MEIVYKELTCDELSMDLFKEFNRFQEVTKCWRNVNGEWLLKDIAFTENWGDTEKQFLIKCLKNTINTKGAVFAAFKEGLLVGFSSLESEFFGSKHQYLQLTSIHTTFELRGYGIGKRLFNLTCEKAWEMGAEKLYISAHSSEETQAFYIKIGCHQTVEINTLIASKEPYDCQLELDL